MSGEIADRCYLPIGMAELDRLSALAAQDRARFFARHPRWARLYGDRVICVALCQGAALHYVNGRNGIKDWDVWTFYRRHPEAHFPARRIANLAFGDPRFGDARFGRRVADGKYVGRRVDLIGRAISAVEHEDPALAVQHYLMEGRTESARRLAEKAVVLLDPVTRRGEIIWPVGAARQT